MLMRDYPPYVFEQFNRLLQEKDLYHSDWLGRESNLLRQFEGYVEEARSSYLKELGLSRLEIGEERVEEELELMSSHCNYLSNVRLEVDGMSVETDNIVFSSNGIFLLEVKNFGEKGSYSLKIAKDGQWQRILKNGEVVPMKDVQAQNNSSYFLEGTIHS